MVPREVKYVIENICYFKTSLIWYALTNSSNCIVVISNSMKYVKIFLGWIVIIY